MQFSVSAGLAKLLSGAYGSGVEVSLGELALLLGLEGDVLTSAEQVGLFTNDLGLELVPGLGSGEFHSPRILRQPMLGGDQAGRILELLSTGENSKLEFKSSLLCSMREWDKSGEIVELDALPGEVLKTICAFLNTDGGSLLIGVDDDGQPCMGIGIDLQARTWTLDTWQLHLASLIETRFHDGGLVSPFVQIRVGTVGGNTIVHVEVLQRETRSFVQKTKGAPFECFVRNGSRTNSLTLPAFYSHLAARSSR